MILNIQPVDHNHLERIYRENYSMLEKEAYKLIKDEVVAQDIASNSFLTLMRYRDSYGMSRQSAKALLRVFTQNAAITYIRKKEKVELLTEYHNNVAIEYDLSLEAEVIYDKQNIIESINLLPPNSKRVMKLMLKGLKIVEIAAKMDLSPTHVSRLRAQGMKQLRNLIINNEHLNFNSHKQPESREQIIKIKEEVNEEFIKYYTKHPHKLYSVSPRQYEIFVAELLKDMGYEVWLNNHTRDGGRDIIAVLKTPSNDSIVTIVECKKYSLDNPVPIEIVERFMYTIREKDKANAGWIVTTSTFSRDAQKCQHNYRWLLKLKDNKDLATLCSNYGKWKRTNEGSGLWLPDNPL